MGSLGALFTFLSSSVGRYVLGAGVGVVVLAGVWINGDMHGRAMANANCEAGKVAAEKALHAKEQLAADTANVEDNKHAEQDQVSEAKVETKDEKFQTGVGPGPCFSGDDDKRLRDAWRVAPAPKKPSKSGPNPSHFKGLF